MRKKSYLLENHKNHIFEINAANFEDISLELFRFQAINNPIYASYIKYLGITIENINKIQQIPFLPIEFFKYHTIKSTNNPTQTIFESSGTTGQIRSQHHVTDLAFYEKIATFIFQKQYGNLENYHLLALLPNYLERKNSSLVYMIQSFMQKTSSESDFYLYDFEKLNRKIQELKNTSKTILIWGVTFALLDFAKEHPQNLKNTIIMDTGGMKGRGKELLKNEVNKLLEDAFQTNIHSEYGMTELLSQAYAKNGLFETPPFLKIYLRDLNDPFCIDNSLRQGGINVIDLANIDSCCFIETKDIGRFVGDKFEVLGRYDNSDIRGCNLLYVG